MTAGPATGGHDAHARSGVPIRIECVTKIFGEDGDKPFMALKEIDIDIAPGEFISVVGPSGCGKSTLMLMVAGLLKRTQGDIRVGGKYGFYFSQLHPVTSQLDLKVAPP